MEFGEKLQNLRKASNLSQEQLADMLNVSRQSVSKWESGATYPEMDKLIAMAKIFKCSMDDLVNNEVKDKEIVTAKNKQVNVYVDSLLNFIVDTVNMFFSMKFTTVIKTLIEIFIIGLVLFGGSFFLIEIFYHIFDSFYFGGDLIRVIFLLMFVAIILIVSGVAITAFIQIFKIRYLDYYRKAIYKEAQIKDLKLEINNNPEINLEEKKKANFKKDKEPVIIMRDPNGTNLKFLEKFVGGLKRAMSMFIMAILGFMVLPTSVFLIVSLVICLYLLSVNAIFFGIVLGIVGFLIICFEVLELIYILLTEKKAPVKRWAIMFLMALVISSVGTGLSLIKLKDIKIVENGKEQDIYSVNLDFEDDLTIATEIDRTIHFIIDENVKNVKIDVEYLKDFIGVSLVDVKGRNVKFVEFDYKNYSTYNTISKLLDGLKDNKLYENYDYSHNSITITANKKNVKKLISNLSDMYFTYIRPTEKGYNVDIEDVGRDKDVCKINDDGIKSCYRILGEPTCDIKLDNNGNVLKEKTECECFSYRNEIHCVANNSSVVDN